MGPSELELGLRLLRAGRAQEAVGILERAFAANPGNVQLMLALGIAERATGRVDRAGEAFEGVTRLAPRSPVAWYDLGLVRRDQGRLRDSVLAFRRAAELNPSDFDAVQNVVTTLATAVRQGERLFPAISPSPRPSATHDGVSVVTCSIDDERLRRFQERMLPHLAGRPHEIIAIRDARSMYDGFRRGWESTRHPIVAFCHDDFAILSDDPFDPIEAALRQADVVGLAGSALASGPGVLWPGHPHIHGWIAHPARSGPGLDVAVLSLRAGVIGGMHALDGMFMAMRRDVPARIPFDEVTFDGFHFYDLDFTYRAAAAGLRVAVTTDVVALHESTGKFDANYERYAARFREKFPGLTGPRGKNHWYDARVDDAAQAVAFYGQLRALLEVS